LGAVDDVAGGAGAIRAVGLPPPVLGIVYAMGARQDRAELTRNGVTHRTLPIPRRRCRVVWAVLLVVTWLTFASRRRC
jgi:hypothetical protein